MSPNSARKAEQLGYTNTKIYHEGLPEWTKKNYTVLSPQFLKEAFIDKDIAHVLLDVRSTGDAKKGFIKGAVTLPLADIESATVRMPKDLKAPVIVYDDKGGDAAVTAARDIMRAGYTNVKMLTGGLDAWKAAGMAVETGAISAKIVYVPKPRPGEMLPAEFKKLAEATPADALILDVRNQDEANAGMIKGALLVPDEEISDRLAEIPKDKLIVTHCATGVRAEMAYHKLKDKGYNVKFLNTNIKIDKAGAFEITK